jgi:ribosomal protein S18 acetylase RimI-like enzyme
MEINIRPLRMTDLPVLTEIDHSFHTDHVWQMDLETSDDRVATGFRKIRLPRSMKVEYPRETVLLADDFKEKVYVFVADVEEEPAGYLAVSTGGPAGIAQALDFAVLRRLRRNGIGTALVRGAIIWTHENRIGQLILEMQSKNFPAINLANKLGFEFCGYNDRYYPNQDIALFFAKRR